MHGVRFVNLPRLDIGIPVRLDLISVSPVSSMGEWLVYTQLTEVRFLYGARRWAVGISTSLISLSNSVRLRDSATNQRNLMEEIKIYQHAVGWGPDKEVTLVLMSDNTVMWKDYKEFNQFNLAPEKHIEG